MSSACDFGLNRIVPLFAETGGDCGVVMEWSAMVAGGGCGGEPDGCPIPP